MAGEQVRRVRIFLASPSADTQEARQHAVKALEAIIDDQQYGGQLDIELWRWDNPRRAVVCERRHNPQRDILRQIGSPAECDLVIGVFAHTMGGTLDDQPPFGRHPTEDRLWHCSEWEVEAGLKSAHTRSVWVFHDQRELPKLPRAQKAEALRESARVCDYIMRSNRKGEPIEEGWNEFDGPQALGDLLSRHVRDWLHREFLSVDEPEERGDGERGDDDWRADRLDPDQQALLDALCVEPDEITEPDAARLALAERVLAAPVRGLRGYLLSRYAAWSDAAHRLDREFVNLDLLTDHGAGAAGLRLTADQRYDSLVALLETHSSVRGWLLVGQPGGGKSTLLQHLEMTQARRALRALQRGEALPPVCVWQRLADCPHDAPDLSAWLAAQWAQRYPDLPTLDRLAGGVVRWRWLLDGVNEIQAPDADAHRGVVRRWAKWAEQLLSVRHAAPIFSVRTAENSTTLSTDALTVRQIRVARWTEDQIKRYCDRRLGTGNTLWTAIRGGAHDTRGRAQRLELASLPFNLSAQCQLFEALGRAVTDRAELLSGLAWLRLRRAHARDELEAPGLLDEEDRELLVDDVWWREHLHQLPDQGRLVAGLDRQAAEMHRASAGTEISLPRSEITPWLDEAGRADWLKAVQRLELAGIDRDTRRFRYTHQLWQEFFAARGVRHRPPEASEMRMAWKAPALERLDTLVGRLAAADPLPVPGVSAWEMAVRMAVVLGDAPGAWIEALMPVNLALAGRAAAGCRDRLDAALLGRLRQALLTRSRAAAVDIRLRIEAAEALGDLGDPRYVEGRGPGPEKHRYLMPTAEYWVKVPADRYVIGSNDGHYQDETPLTSVPLGEFHMAFAPVTNAEFRCFVEAGGYEDERWWQGETARRWRREGIRNEESFQRWRPRLAALRQNFDDALRQYFPNETQGYIEKELRIYAGWSEVEAEAKLEASFGARIYRKPGSLEQPQFDHGSQPVTEVSLFEARAYACWLSAQTGQSIRLPTEAEWEAAARRDTGRRWPWGPTDPDCWQMNADPSHLRRTSPVGVFAQGDTPEGLTDMAGNVWEWTSSAYTERHDLEALTTVLTDDSVRRVVRGGAWNNSSVYCRASYRYGNDPVDRSSNLGLRLVRALVPHSEPGSLDHRASDATPRR